MQSIRSMFGVAVLTCAVGLCPAAHAQFPPGPVQFPLVGVGLGQVLRLSAVAHPPGPCIATLAFVDFNGEPVGPSPMPINLATGQATFLDLPVNTAVSFTSTHAEIRPLPTVMLDLSGAGGDCAFFAELFIKAIGLSQVFLPPGPNQMPGEEGTFPLMGVGFGQVQRLTAVALPPGPCIVTLSFVDASGVLFPLGTVQLTVEPGDGAWIDLSVPVFFAPDGRRLSRPVLRASSVPGAAACVGVKAAAEIFERLSGDTATIAFPAGPIP
jgi:hypothetical protein